MILSDRTMREQIEQGRIRIEPLAEGAIQPSSIDLRLGDKIRVFRNNHISHIDLRHDTAALTEVVELKPGQPFFLRPLEFALGVTVEHIVVPDDLVARWMVRSSLGAGWLADPCHGRPRRSRLAGPVYAGADESGAVPDHPVRRHADWADLVHPDDQPGSTLPYGGRALASKYQGDTDPTPAATTWSWPTWAGMLRRAGSPIGQRPGALSVRTP